MENRYYLAIDIGASSGRHILAHKKDGRIVLEEIYRFPNGMQEHNGHKVWNVDQLFGEIQTGMKKCADIGKIPYSMGIDRSPLRQFARLSYAQEYGVHSTLRYQSPDNICFPLSAPFFSYLIHQKDNKNKDSFLASD
jgi:hypothetical protein